MPLSQDAVCNLIKTRRRYNRLNVRTKTITFFMFHEKKIKISTFAIISVHLKTGNVSAVGCIRVGRKSIYLGTYGKRNCNDPIYVETISEKFRAKNLKWYHLNKEKISARNREYYDSNKEKTSARRLEWYHLNKDKINARRRELRAEKKNRN